MFFDRYPYDQVDQTDPPLSLKEEEGGLFYLLTELCLINNGIN